MRPYQTPATLSVPQKRSKNKIFPSWMAWPDFKTYNGHHLLPNMTNMLNMTKIINMTNMIYHDTSWHDYLRNVPLSRGQYMTIFLIHRRKSICWTWEIFSLFVNSLFAPQCLLIFDLSGARSSINSFNSCSKFQMLETSSHSQQSYFRIFPQKVCKNVFSDRLKNINYSKFVTDI